MAQSSTPGVPSALVTASILMLSAMTIMANATISPSLPALREHYADVPGIGTLTGLLLTLPSAAIVLSASLMGWLADRLDRQKLLLASGLLYALGGTSGLWVDSLAAMLVGRVVLGLGVAGTMILATTWSADLWQGSARERYLGRQGAAMSGGGIVVMLLGGALASLHWRGAFATYGLVVPVTLLALYALAPYARERRSRPPVQEAVPVAFPWSTFAFVGPLAFLFMAVFYVLPTRGPFLLGSLGVHNPLAVGAIMSLMTLASVPGALNYGRLRLKLDPLAIFAISWALMGFGMAVIALAPSAGVLALGVVIMGLGMGPSMPNYTAYWMAAVPPASRGRASGFLTTAFFVGQFASPLLTTPLIGAFGLSGTFLALAAVQVVLALILGVVALRGMAATRLGQTARAHLRA